jgi:hypothetical protein
MNDGSTLMLFKRAGCAEGLTGEEIASRAHPDAKNLRGKRGSHKADRHYSDILDRVAGMHPLSGYPVVTDVQPRGRAQRKCPQSSRRITP